MKKRQVKVLLNPGVTGNFVSDTMVITLKLKVQSNNDFHDVTLADGTIVQTVGYVQFMMDCGDYKSKTITRVFPSLHKECFLGMPWLVRGNLIIDWACKQVTIQRSGYILSHGQMKSAAHY